PLIPHVIGGISMVYADRLFISEMSGLEQLGYYSVGYQIGMVLSLFQNSFNQAWIPWIFEQMKLNKPEVKQKIVKFTYLYFLGLLAMVVLVWLFLPLIFRFFIGDNFQDAMPFVIYI